MDGTRFDDMTKRLTETGTRRRLLGGFAGGALAGFLALAAGDEVGAQEAAGRAAERCLREKQACKRGNQCCSGLCKGKRGKKKCRRAPGQGTCTTDRDICRVGEPRGICTKGANQCGCLITTRGTAFCAGVGVATVCATDADCVAAFDVPNLVCARTAGAECNDLFNSPTACVLPCGGDAPAALRRRLGGAAESFAAVP